MVRIAMAAAWMMVASASWAGDEAKDAPEDKAVAEERAKFDGVWRFESVEAGGKKLPLSNFQDAKLTLKGKTFAFRSEGVDYAGTYTVDVSQKPKTIDVTFTSGPEAGKVSKGIYELDGDTYKTCMGLAGKDRPKAFGTKKGDDSAVLEVLKRKKP